MNDISKQAVVVSLYPAPLGEVKRPGFLPTPTFTMPACNSLDNPVLLVVPMQTEKFYVGHDRTMTTAWAAKDVAEDIVREWTSGLPGTNLAVGALPGVWVSEGAHQVNGEWVIPQAELDAQRKGLDLTLRRLVMTARELHGTDGKNATQILPVMHTAAKWLKVEGEAWQQDLTSEARFSCPFCKGVNQNGASTCIHCKNVIDQKKFDATRALIQRHEDAIEGTDNDAPPDEQALSVRPSENKSGSGKGSNKGALASV